MESKKKTLNREQPQNIFSVWYIFSEIAVIKFFENRIDFGMDCDNLSCINFLFFFCFFFFEKKSGRIVNYKYFVSDVYEQK